MSGPSSSGGLKPPSLVIQTDAPLPSPPLHGKVSFEPGCQPDEVYDKLLSPWRAGMRRYLVQRLRDEKDWMAEWQKRVRTPMRDTFFYWTAIFGTHAFLATCLPLSFFFGFPERGREMIYNVSLGVYVSSFAKDVVCTPRPYSPPVIRISMSNHHHEYGFPSSHSTNSVSIALFLADWAWQTRSVFGTMPVMALWTVLFLYASSVVAGRLYTGMHSTADIICGSLMGFACWALVVLFKSQVEVWAASAKSSVPLISIPLILALVHYHPEPVDDCPCFEDAIAVLGVTLGGLMGQWTVAKGVFVPSVGTTLLGMGRSPLLVAFLSAHRIVFGIGCMIAFRLVAKSILLQILPPVFRYTSTLFDFQLPTRRFYKSAADYQEVPPAPLRTIPSMLDLRPDDQPSPSNSTDGTPGVSGSETPVFGADPQQLSFTKDGKLSTSPISLKPPSDLRRRHGGSDGASRRQLDGSGVEKEIQWVPRRKRKNADERAKYDAEVLTKVGVYTGIAFLATTVLPWLFSLLEPALGFGI